MKPYLLINMQGRCNQFCEVDPEQGSRSYGSVLLSKSEKIVRASGEVLWVPVVSNHRKLSARVRVYPK